MGADGLPCATQAKLACWAWRAGHPRPWTSHLFLTQAIGVHPLRIQHTSAHSIVSAYSHEHHRYRDSHSSETAGQAGSGGAVNTQHHARRWRRQHSGHRPSPPIHDPRGCTAHKDRRWASFLGRWISRRRTPSTQVGPEGVAQCDQGGGREVLVRKPNCASQGCVS